MLPFAWDAAHTHDQRWENTLQHETVQYLCISRLTYSVKIQKKLSFSLSLNWDISGWNIMQSKNTSEVAKKKSKIIVFKLSYSRPQEVELNYFSSIENDNELENRAIMWTDKKFTRNSSEKIEKVTKGVKMWKNWLLGDLAFKKAVTEQSQRPAISY